MLHWHLSPADFWGLTPIEWRWLSEAESGLSSADVTALKAKLTNHLTE